MPTECKFAFSCVYLRPSCTNEKRAPFGIALLSILLTFLIPASVAKLNAVCAKPNQPRIYKFSIQNQETHK